MMARAGWLVVLSCLAAVGCADDPDDPSVHEPEEIDFARFDAALQQAIDEHNAASSNKIAGASAAVVHEKLGVLHTQAFGEFEVDRLFLIASSSKILSAGVLMRLADQGKLDVDTGIGTYLADWGETKVSTVSVAQLLSNSAGLPSLTEVTLAAINPSSPFASNLCQYSAAGVLQDCGKALYETDPPRKPDTAFAYGGSQWQLAGAVAELVSGESWSSLIDSTYREPCDVPTLGYTNQFGRGDLGYPAFFQAQKENLPETENPSIEGGAYVTVADYAKLLLMHLRGGTCGDNRVLSAEATARMQKNRLAEYGGRTGNANAPGYGLGFWINEAKQTVTDPGAYGAYPLLDLQRRYGVFIAIELSSDVGTKLGAAVKPALDEIFDEAEID
jgi:CubicO group peptidase (beta-lactamase class C family)